MKLSTGNPKDQIDNQIIGAGGASAACKHGPSHQWRWRQSSFLQTPESRDDFLCSLPLKAVIALAKRPRPVSIKQRKR